MTRNEIEKAADEFGIENNCLRVSTALASMMIEQVNAVIDQAVYRIDRHFGIDQDGNHGGIDIDDPVFIRDEIRALKIK